MAAVVGMARRGAREPTDLRAAKGGFPFMIPDNINEHLTDIVADVNRVRKAINDDEAPHLLTEDAIKSHLCDVSNALDDLYNQIVGI